MTGGCPCKIGSKSGRQVLLNFLVFDDLGASEYLNATRGEALIVLVINFAEAEIDKINCPASGARSLFFSTLSGGAWKAFQSVNKRLPKARLFVPSGPPARC